MCEVTLDKIENKKSTLAPSDASNFFTTEPRGFEPQSIKNESTFKSNRDLSKLKNDLNEYIIKRQNEWSFHYNFLGIVSVVYWLCDALSGTDYFNSKSRETKISAAKHLIEVIENGNSPLPDAEINALNEGQLGAKVKHYGGLKSIQQQAAAQLVNNDTGFNRINYPSQ